MRRYAELFARWPWLVAAFAGLVTLAALAGLARLRFDDVPRGIFVSDDEDFRRLERLYQDFGSDDNDVLLVLEAEDWFTPSAAALLRETVESVRAVRGIESLVALTEVPLYDAGALPRPPLPPPEAPPSAFAAARERALAHPLIGGLLLSRDGRTTLVAARLAGGALSVGEIAPVVEELRGIAAEVEARGARARLTGVPTIRLEIYDTIRREQAWFLAAGAVLCTVLAWLLFRSPWACLATCLPPLLAALWSLGLAGLAGREIDLLSSVLPMLVIVIAFTDAVHLVIDVQLSRAAGLAPLQASAAAIRHVGLPCAMTSLTTAVGFGSLAIGDIAIIRRFGLISAASVIVAFVAVITVLPWVASRLRDVGRPPATMGGGGPVWRRAGGLIGGAVRHARVTAVGGTALVLALAAISLRLQPENRLTEALPHANESYRALVHAQQAFGGILPAHVLVTWPEPLGVGSPEVVETLAEVEALLAARPELSPPVSLLGLLAGLPPALRSLPQALELLPEHAARRVVRPDLRQALVSANMPDAGSEVMTPLVGELRAGLRAIEARRPGIELHLTGTDVVARSNVNRMIEGLALSLGTAALVIFGAIGLEFRSLRVGLVSLLPNVFPLALTGAFLVVSRQPLQVSSAMVFTILLGLAVDDTIHFLARLRREERTRGTEGAIQRTYLAVGHAILTTSVVLLAGYAILLASSIGTTRLFGALACLGLLGALAGDLVLLPALLVVFPGRRRRGSVPEE